MDNAISSKHFLQKVGSLMKENILIKCLFLDRGTRYLLVGWLVVLIEMSLDVSVALG